MQQKFCYYVTFYNYLYSLLTWIILSIPLGPRLVLTASESAFAAWMLLFLISSGFVFLDFINPPDPPVGFLAAAAAKVIFTSEKVFCISILLKFGIPKSKNFTSMIFSFVLPQVLISNVPTIYFLLEGQVYFCSPFSLNYLHIWLK